ENEGGMHDLIMQRLEFITGDVRDRPQSGHPKKKTPQVDRFLTLSALRNRRQSSTDLQSRFVGQYGRRAARRPAMTAFHCQARLLWCLQHVHWNLNMWRNVMFSDEYRCSLWQLDRKVKVWRRRGERYADRCAPTG
uniref:Transposase Tc1-like domain-containing protein n=1 Tax=Labrus bergylta TaxID=56723 RepID=A0A3Q3NBJ3_9LABR